MQSISDDSINNWIITYIDIIVLEIFSIVAYIFKANKKCSSFAFYEQFKSLTTESYISQLTETIRNMIDVLI